MPRRIIIWTPTIIWATLIFALSSVPALKASDNPIVQNIINTLGHFTEYFVLTLLIARSLKKEHVSNHTHLASYLSIIYALSDELHQSFVPGRVADLKDISIDFMGTLAAIWWIRRRQVK